MKKSGLPGRACAFRGSYWKNLKKESVQFHLPVCQPGQYMTKSGGSIFS